jgi:hypothetical protein
MGPSVAAARAPSLAGNAPTAAPIADPMMLEDEAAPAVPPMQGTDPFWGGIAEGVAGYRPRGEAPLVAGAEAFFRAKAAGDRIKSENERQAYEDRRRDEEWDWRKSEREEIRRDRAEDRALRREESAASRLYREKAFGLQERAADRADRADARTAQSHDYEILDTAIQIETARRALMSGATLSADDTLNLANARKVELESIENNYDLTAEEKAAAKARINAKIDQLLQLSDQNARDAAADAEAGNVVGQAKGNPGATSNTDEGAIDEDADIGAVPEPEAPVDLNSLGGEGMLGAEDTGPAPPVAKGDPAAPPKASDYFSKPPKFSGTGTKDDPLDMGNAPVSEEDMRQIMYLYVKPGQWIRFGDEVIMRAPRTGN